MAITTQHIRELAARGLLDVRSVRRAYTTPEKIRPVTWERVRRTAVELGLPQPPPVAAKVHA